ncbi:MAG: hypothetical protein AAGE61_01990 [Pseudomonadota bacterium]
MSDAIDERKQDEEEPLDPAVERVRQRLKRLLLGSTLIMFLGFGSVVAAIIYKINEPSDEQQASAVPALVTDETLRRARYPLPEGARVNGTSIDDGMIAVTYELPAGAGGGILLIDIETWQVFSVMDLPTK